MNNQNERIVMLGKRPTEPGNYKYRPFWGGRNLFVRDVIVYEKNVTVDNEPEESRNELVFDIAESEYSILVCATDPDRWFKP